VNAAAAYRKAITPGASTASAVSSLVVYECERNAAHVAIPRPDVALVVRFGPSARGGLDAYAFGVQQTVRRKVVRRGQRTVTAHLHVGAPEAVLGVSASALAGRIVSLDELWADAATRRFFDQLACARDTIDAAAVVESAIAERLATGNGRRARLHLALDAVEKLAGARVNAVAVDLGVSERHLRRVFREAVGVSPKTFAKLTRFRRALGAAREDGGASWASIAATAGYYDQAHLIAEFRAIAGVTPRALLGELRAGLSVG
jgi:AraC-like DNA-binding protein